MNEFQLTIGADVLCTDGKCGRLSKIVVDPETNHVTHIVAEAGLLLKHAHAFPFSIIERSNAQQTELSIHSDQIADYNEYRLVEVEHVVPDAAGGLPLHVDTFGAPTSAPRITKVREKVHQGISPKLVVLDRNTPISSPDGTIGPMLHLFVAADSGQIERLVTRRGVLKASLPVISASFIDDITDERIFTSALSEDVKTFPDYTEWDESTSMESMEESVSGIKAEEAGAPEESGETFPTTTMPISRQIESVLASDPRTRNAVIDVIDERGVIMLVGEVASPTVREAAEEIALQQPGVVSVVNNLRIR